MLYLTYDAKQSVLQHGIGAQYQRVIGIICIALQFNLNYVHTKIQAVETANGFEVDEKYINYMDDYFQFCKYFPTVDSIKYDEIYEMCDPSINDILCKYTHDKDILLQISMPFAICDRNTLIYSNNMPILREIIAGANSVGDDRSATKENENFPLLQKKTSKIEIAIHIRRGDVDDINNNNRYTPIDVYIKIIETFKNKCENCNITVYTEFNNIKNKNEFDFIKNDENITIKADVDPIQSIHEMSVADILVIGKSSFSYVAGLYNKNTVYYFNFWHSPLNNWVNVNTLL
jgi:hypothetical protein